MMVRDCEPLPGMIGRHPSMLEVFWMIRRVAPTDLSVVLSGETGTGKELVAQAIYALGGSVGRFVDINCAAIPDTLVETELFGSVKGAYTGSIDSPGLLEFADGGTLFLDEACSLLKIVQSKLLRAIELHHHRRVGGKDRIKSRFRLILAVQRPIEQLVADGLYLPAFAHRVNGLTVHLPSLASRGEDIALLARHFLVESALKSGRPLTWSEDALMALQHMPWPGNVRQLRALVARLPLLATEDLIEASDVHPAMDRTAASEITPEVLKATLDRHKGNVSRAARELGMPRTTLRSRVMKTAAD